MAADRQIRDRLATGAASGLGRAMTLGLLTADIDVAGVDRNVDGLAGVGEGGAAGEVGRTGYCTPSVLIWPIRRRSTALWRTCSVTGIWSTVQPVSVTVRFETGGGRTAPITRAVRYMLARKAGRIITVTTSLGTMVRAGYLLYGASKAAAEAAMAVLSNDLVGTGVTANVLVPGGVTNTPLVGDDAGDRDRMLQPDVMVPPLLYLVSRGAACM